LIEDKAEPDSRCEGTDPAAVSLGQGGGLKGGKARAAKLSPEQRPKLPEGGRKAMVIQMALAC
jgi:hypothetical protein